MAMNAASIERLDTNGEPLQVNGRYWVVDDAEGEAFIYDSLIDVDNFLETFGDGGHDDYFLALLALYGYCHEAKRYRYMGGDTFEEEK